MKSRGWREGSRGGPYILTTAFTHGDVTDSSHVQKMSGKALLWEEHRGRAAVYLSVIVLWVCL